MLTGRDPLITWQLRAWPTEAPGSVHLGRAGPGPGLQLMLMQEHALTLVPKESQQKVAAAARYGICSRLASAHWLLLPISKC